MGVFGVPLVFDSHNPEVNKTSPRLPLAITWELKERFSIFVIDFFFKAEKQQATTAKCFVTFLGYENRVCFLLRHCETIAFFIFAKKKISLTSYLQIVALTLWLF